MIALMQMPDRHSPRPTPAELEAEEVAALIQSTADFWCWQDAGGGEFQLWKLRKPLFGHAVGSLIARADLVRILRGAMQPKYGKATVE